MSARVEKNREFIEAHTYLEPNTGCWLWERYCDPNGYGRIGKPVEGETLLHRLSWVRYRGPIPDDLLVLHRCDTPSCCNPAHLFLGTHQDNSDDKHNKGRNVQGKAILTLAQVKEAYTVSEAAQSVADRFGVARNVIYQVRGRSNWAGVTAGLTPGDWGPGRNGRPTLKAHQVREIYQSGEKPAALAKRFGVCRGNIYNINNGESWTHVTEGLTRGT